jgi:5-hydroxyisourate hydrolase-like protein (transthyretin family)
LPASGVPVTLLGRDEDGSWRPLGSGDTDQDGRLTTLPTVQNGLHRLQFVGMPSPSRSAALGGR